MANTISEEKIRNLQIRQTWLEEQASDICKQYQYKNVDAAFEALVYSLLFDLDYDAVQPDEIVDGGQDKQVDIIKIDDDVDNHSATIYIIQAKMVTGFSSNTLIQMRNGLNWIFDQPKVDYLKITNKKFVNKIDEIRQIRLDYGASNISIKVFFVTLGDIEDLSAEYKQEKKILIDTYKNVGFFEFEYSEIGAFELFELMNESERVKRKIDVNIPIVYDVNRASLVNYTTGETRALICTITGLELARIASLEPKDAIFDLNVRPYYGSRGQVNSEIMNTCTSNEASHFWFLNNGITMVCDSFDLVTDPDNPMVKVENAQIVNGCQTSVTIREAWEKNKLRDEVKVLLKIYATTSSSLSGRITLTTNNQNRITDRDLRANDSVQIDFQKLMLEKFGFFYERKNKQYKNFRGEKRGLIVPNYKAGQAYLAIVRKKPSVARGYLGKIWSDYYREIFENATVEDLLACYLISRYCAFRQKTNEVERYSLQNEISVYGAFHIARICGHFLTNDNWGSRYRTEISAIINNLIENENQVMNEVYDLSINILSEIRKNNLDEYPSPTLYFKAGEVQKSIERYISGDE